jgi:hypothetical protein
MGDGVSFAQSGQYELSYEIFSQITSLYPEYPHGWLWKGTVLHALKRPTEAQESFITGRRLLIEDEVKTSRTAVIPPSLLYQSEHVREQEASYELQLDDEVVQEERLSETPTLTVLPSPTQSVTSLPTPQETDTPFPSLTTPFPSPTESVTSLSTPQETDTPLPSLTPPIPSPTESVTSLSTPQKTDTPLPSLTPPIPSPAQSVTLSFSPSPSRVPSTIDPTLTPSPLMGEEDGASLSTPESPSVIPTFQPMQAYSPSPSFTPVQAIQQTITIGEVISSTQSTLTGSFPTDLDLPDLDLPLIPDNIDGKEGRTEQSTQQPIEISFSWLFVISLIIGVIAGYILLKVM